MARRAIDATHPESDGEMTASIVSGLQSNIGSIRSNIQSKITTLKANRDEILLLGSPEKIRQKFLNDLEDKKIALDSLSGAIAKAENQIKQDEHGLEIGLNGAIKDPALKREIDEKQSQILNQKDEIATKKDELNKMLS